MAVAVDTGGSGHFTGYPADEETVLLQIPFAEGVVPEHKILHQGPCHYQARNGQIVVGKDEL